MDRALIEALLNEVLGAPPSPRFLFLQLGWEASNLNRSTVYMERNRWIAQA
jgi:hypothetical protein